MSNKVGEDPSGDILFKRKLASLKRKQKEQRDMEREKEIEEYENRVNQSNYIPTNPLGRGFGGNNQPDPMILKIDPPQPDYMPTGGDNMRYSGFLDIDESLRNFKEESLRNATNGNLTYVSKSNNNNNEYSKSRNGGKGKDKTRSTNVNSLLWSDSDNDDEEGGRDNRNNFNDSDSNNRGEDYYFDKVNNGRNMYGQSRNHRYNNDGINQMSKHETSSKSWLIKKLKEKFLSFGKDAVNFVSRYLAQTMGPAANENMVYQYLKIIPQMSKVRPTRPEEFHKILDMLYGEDSELAESMVSYLMKKIESDKQINLATRGLAVSARHNPSDKQEERKKRMLKAKETMIQVLRKNRHIQGSYFDTLDEYESSNLYPEDVYHEELSNVHKQLAEKLWNKYKYKIDGNVTVLLDGVLRAQAENALADINGQCHGENLDDYFTLDEVMRSDVVLTKFIRMMILLQQSNPGAAQALFASPWSSQKNSYNTKADTGNYGNFGGSGRNNIFQSRPTQFNIMATNIEYAEGMKLFRRVIKDPSGSGKLIWAIPGNAITDYDYHQNRAFAPPSIPKTLTKKLYHVNQPKEQKQDLVKDIIYWDPQTNAYKTKRPPETAGVPKIIDDNVERYLDETNKRRPKRRKTTLLVPTGDGRLQPVDVRYRKPVTLLRTENSNQISDSFNIDYKEKQRLQRYGIPRKSNHGLIYIEKYENGDSGYVVDKSILRDTQAMTELYKTGIPPARYDIG